eukprot:152694-Pyramimonas_sp.AAC.1
MLRARNWLRNVLNVTVRRDMPLSSHHFLFQARVRARANTDGAEADVSQLADIKTGSDSRTSLLTCSRLSPTGRLTAATCT